MVSKTLAKQIGAIVKGLRNERGWSQESLADKMGVHRNTVRGFEAGEHGVHLETLGCYAAAFGVAPQSLMPPASEVDVDEALQVYRDSPYAQIDLPTEEECVWLRTSPALAWMGGSKTPEVISLVLSAYRKSRLNLENQ
jgi:transcriptional regulator with XRE-family HTH domain